jgi:hypothetical protein
MSDTGPLWHSQIAQGFDAAIESLTSLQGLVLRYLDSQVTETVGVRLPVPWLSQIGRSASFAPGDCGPACLAMWLRFLGHAVTVDDVSRKSGLDRGFSYTMPAHLIHAARAWGVNLYWRRYLDLEAVKAELNAGRPAIVLINYPSLRERFDKRYQSGHWLLIVGYTKNQLIYHDPYWPGPPATKGNPIFISLDDFDCAWGRNHLNGNSDRQALRMR